MWISIDYASKLDKPFFLYAGLIPKSYFGNNFPLFRQLDFGSPGIFLLINFYVTFFFNPYSIQYIYDIHYTLFCTGISFKPNVLLPTTSPIIWVNNSSSNARPKRYIQALSDFLQGIAE